MKMNSLKAMIGFEKENNTYLKYEMKCSYLK